MSTTQKYILQAFDNYPYNLPEALEALEYALSSDPQNTIALTLMGRLYAEQLNEYEMARDYPLISLAAVGTGSVIGTGLGMGVNKLREKNGKKTRTIS